jgi:hypothetical protein
LQLNGKEGLFPANYCKLLYGDDEDSSFDDDDESLSWSSEDEADKKAKENAMYQVCKVCALAQDAALLCRQCGCSLADVPLVRKVNRDFGEVVLFLTCFFVLFRTSICAATCWKA